MKRNSIISQLLIALITLVLWTGCDSSNPNWKVDSEQPEFLHRSLKQITDVIVHDIFSPPVASRIYAYSNIAAYEALAPGNDEYNSLAGQLTGFENVPQPAAGEDICHPLAATRAMLIVGKALIFSETKIDDFEAGLMMEFQAEMGSLQWELLKDELPQR